jgi:SAM-dependent methyltransferase
MISELTDFVLSQLPPTGRVLEVGCGSGELARALDAAGYDVLAIDPEAPEGEIFQRVRLEELDDAGPFDASVASRSLHHIEDLGAALDTISALAPLVVLDEFAWDQMDGRTAQWFDGQRRALEAAGYEPEPLEEDWDAEHAGLHGYQAMRRELDARFDERYFAWTAYLYRYLGGPATQELEQALIDAGAISPLGFRYAGVSSSTRSSPRSR